MPFSYSTKKMYTYKKKSWQNLNIQECACEYIFWLHNYYKVTHVNTLVVQARDAKMLQVRTWGQ